jgi:hypothetical protein
MEINTGDYVYMAAAHAHDTHQIFGEISKIKVNRSNYSFGFTKLGPRVHLINGNTIHYNNITTYATAFRKAVSTGTYHFRKRDLDKDCGQLSLE